VRGRKRKGIRGERGRRMRRGGGRRERERRERTAHGPRREEREREEREDGAWDEEEGGERERRERTGMGRGVTMRAGALWKGEGRGRHLLSRAGDARPDARRVARARARRQLVAFGRRRAGRGGGVAAGG